MRRIFTQSLLIFFTLFFPFAAHALLSMELTRGVSGAIPIAVVPFAGNNGLPTEMAEVITNDLQNSGRFKVYGKSALSFFPSEPRNVSGAYFKRLGADNVVIGKVQTLSADKYQIQFNLLDTYQEGDQGDVLLHAKYTATSRELRKLAHHISDLIFQKLTGTRGIFATKIAYVEIVRSGRLAHYILEVSDQDGFNARPLLNSSEPIMSPAWSPNGRQIAYVSFEKRRAGIYIQDVTSGKRQLISQFPGINGAPAWSPDGKKLAVVLSKSGTPDIYILDIASHQLTKLTHDYYINTEPAWAPNGKKLLFTSNRSGGPQIYEINLATRATNRVSYDGDYNARASYTADSDHIVMIHRVSGIYSIAILDLDTGRMRTLTSSGADTSSPSIAPNGSMVLYDTVLAGKNVLGMVSADGRVQINLPASNNGDAQDPAWSPYL